MANYGKTAYSYVADTGYVTIQNPTHGSLKVNKETGFVGEKITIENSMQENWYIKNYLINATKIEGNSFSLVAGENIVSAEEYYQEESASEEIQITLEFYYDGVLDHSQVLTDTKGDFIRPSEFASLIEGYKYSHSEPVNSFTANADTTIKLYYVLAVNPFDKITLTYNRINATSGTISIQNNNDFDVLISNIYGGINYYSGDDEETIEPASGFVIPANSTYTSETFNTPLGHYFHRYFIIMRGNKVGSEDTYSSEAYSGDIETSDIKLNITINAYEVSSKKGSYTIQVNYGSTISISDIKSEINSRFSLEASEYDRFETAFSQSTNYIYPKSDGEINVYYEKAIFYSLTIEYWTNDAISGPAKQLLSTKSYSNIKKGTTIKLSDYLTAVPSHYDLEESYNETFTLNSNTTKIVYCVRETYTLTLNHYKGTSASSSNLYRTTHQSAKYGASISSFKPFAIIISDYAFDHSTPSAISNISSNHTVAMYYRQTATYYTLTCKHYNEVSGVQMGRDDTYSIREGSSVRVDNYRKTFDGFEFSYSSPSAGSSVTMTGNKIFSYYYTNRASGIVTVTANLSGSSSSPNGYSFSVTVKNDTPSSLTVSSISSGCGISVSGVPATISSGSSRTFAGSSKFVFVTPGIPYTCTVSTSQGDYTDTYSL